METKKCNCCGLDKPLDEFYSCKKTRDGKLGHCGKCASKKSAASAKKHKDKVNAKRRARRLIPEIKEKISDYKKLQYYKNRTRTIFNQTKSSAKIRGLEFNLDIADIIIPEYCPILEVKLDNKRYLPSLDRIDNSKGYIKGNVWVISRKANTMKNDASFDELEKFCRNLIIKITKTNIIYAKN